MPKVAPRRSARRAQGDSTDTLKARLGRAASPDTPVAQLARLVSDPEPRVRVSLAANPRTPKTVLARLAKDTKPSVLRAVAANPGISKAAAAILAAHKSESIRSLVARNPAVPTPVLMKLAKDPSWGVAAGLAANRRLSLDQVEALFPLRYNGYLLRNSALERDDVSDAVMAKWIERHGMTMIYVEDQEFLRQLLEHPRVGEKTLVALACAFADNSWAQTDFLPEVFEHPLASTRVAAAVLDKQGAVAELDPDLIEHLRRLGAGERSLS